MARKKAVKKQVKSRSKAKSVRAPVSESKKNTQTFAIVTLLLNVFIPLGIGSILGGKIKQGIAQLVLMIIGVILPYEFGVPIIVISWIWQVVTGVMIVQEASK